MADGLNRVLLFGNLGADPELRTTSGGQSVLKMRLATTESYLDRDRVRQERTEWHNVVVWGKRAEALGRFLSKGSRLFVEGSLRTSSYEDKEGQKRWRTEVVASNVILGGRGGERGAGGSASDDHGGPPDEHESRSRAPARPAASGGYDDADYGGGDDDIPF
ncbi:MAG: single-stranded DNA-binding protein [Polyangiaceae bacterium]|nr:single-stranded DNA-binding protein [Polyangiaceae bacterium]